MRRRIGRPHSAVLAGAALAVAFAAATGHAGADTRAAGNGVTCDGRAATIIGTENGDNLEGTPGDDVIAALGGKDDVRDLSTGRDSVCGGDGSDELETDDSARDEKRLFGEDGDDFVGNVDASFDVTLHLDGGGGDDILRGSPQPDVLRGARGEDGMASLIGGDDVRGGKADDEAFGGRGPDELDGGGGDDRLKGEQGRDRANGDGGSDRCRAEVKRDCER